MPASDIGLVVVGLLSAVASAASVLVALRYHSMRSRSARRRESRNTSDQWPIQDDVYDDNRPVKDIERTDEQPHYSTPPSKPIARLSPQARQALGYAHLGLRRLALASRSAPDIPSDLFRLVEARASVALDGPDIALDDALIAALEDYHQNSDEALVLRTAHAISIGWNDPGNSPVLGEKIARPVTPVRALNPLVEIAFEHLILAARRDRHSHVVARAVTIVDVMRAARLLRPVFALSPTLLTDAERYHRALNSDLADPRSRDGLVRLFCAAIGRSSTDCATKLAHLDLLRDQFRQRLVDVRTLQVFDLLLSHPIVDTRFVALRLSIPRTVASDTVEEIASSGWLQPHHGRADTWVADRVLSLFAGGDPGVEVLADTELSRSQRAI